MAASTLPTSPMPDKPTALTPIFENIPTELTQRKQWVLWRYTENKNTNKWTKPPFQPNGKLASTTKENTWSTFDQVVTTYKASNTFFDGIGFVFNNDYTGIDKDKNIATDLVVAVNSYAELSPSGNGVHILTRGAVSTEGGRRNSDTEIYFTGRYFTVTGHILPEANKVITDTNGVVHETFDSLPHTDKTDNVQPTDATNDNTQVAIDPKRLAVAKAHLNERLARKNGFYKLWHGKANYESNSEAIYGLMKDLLNLTLFDIPLAKELIQLSPIYQINPEKYARTLVNYDATKALTSLKTETVPIEPKRTWLRFNELAQLPKPSYLIDDIIQGEITVIYAPSASGKTFTAIHYAMLAAQAHQVMYVAAEDLNGVAMRASAWLEYHSTSVGDNFMVWPEELNLMNGEADLFLSEVTSLNLELIIIDTLALCMIGGDENSTKDMGLFIHNIKRIQNATGAAIIILHHTDKKGIAERGNSALRAAAYTMLSLSKINNIIMVENVKAKNTQVAPTKAFQLIKLDKDRALISNATKRMDFSIGEDHISVLKYMQSMEGGARYTTIKIGLHIPDKKLAAILNRLEAHELIEKPDLKAPWKVTLAGEKLLSEQNTALESDET